MWVWSDEFVEGASTTGSDGWDREPLVAYAVASEADVEDLAREVLSEARAEAANRGPAGRGAVDG